MWREGMARTLSGPRAVLQIALCSVLAETAVDCESLSTMAANITAQRYDVSITPACRRRSPEAACIAFHGADGLEHML